MKTTISRREAIKTVSTVSTVLLLPSACTDIKSSKEVKSLFNHGVASGDPDSSSIVIWTRVSDIDQPIKVNWFIATDKKLKNTIKQGKTTTNSDRDFTVKVIVSDLEPGKQYFYKFEVNEENSPIGRTKTLPTGHVEKLVLAVATCSNYPFGYFNGYDAIANDPTVDLVVHLGDYIYEYAIAGYGGESGKKINRNHEPAHEILSLNDYRKRHAQYKADVGSRALHAQHPLIVIWDDHETANNPWMAGAKNHQENEGDWLARREASLQAYYEWLPIRDPIKKEDRKNYWRHYKFGDLASLITLESRHTGRSEQISYKKHLHNLKTSQQAQAFLNDNVEPEERNMLSKEMEAFLKNELSESVKDGRRWRVIGNQTLLARASAPKLDDPIFTEILPNLNPKAKSMLEELTHLGELNLPSDLDTWDGYPAARERFYQIAKDANSRDLLVLTGDSHSYWANSLFDENDKAMGIELGATGISSPRSILGLGEEALEKYDELNASHNKEVNWTDGRHQGFIRLELDHKGAHADFITVSTVKSTSYKTKIAHSVNIHHSNGSLSYGKSPQ